jgi:deoxyribodipyrimidine photo-lyase
MKKVTFFWFRRDLRLEDNTGLYFALKERGNVLPLFIFDSAIIDKLEDKNDKRISFIFDQLSSIKKKLEKSGTSLLIKYGNPKEVIENLCGEYDVEAVYVNHDYEPYAIRRDEQIKKMLRARLVEFKSFKDQVILEKSEVTKADGKPYTIFTPYSRKWREVLKESDLSAHPSEKFTTGFLKTVPFKNFELKTAGFIRQEFDYPTKTINEHVLKDYHKTRDIPSIEGTSRLSVHLRFGTLSIRKLAKAAMELNETYLNELIWREFYMMILWHFPGVVDKAFKPQYDKVNWINNEKDFEAWCLGKTGYPIVDAGMRQLNQTGYMHNRVRMITASFLVKHLLIDWRWGEACFAKKLLDYELSSNNGGWQWAAGSGCDAVPYFRIFNPTLQTKKFDPDLRYIQKWVPEFQESGYPKPIVEHKFARERALSAFKNALS